MNDFFLKSFYYQKNNCSSSGALHKQLTVILP